MPLIRDIVALTAALALALAACGGGGSGGGNAGGNPPPPADPQTSVSGTVFASDALTSGSVTAYSFTGGVKGGLLATSAINSVGAYQFTVPASSGAILIEASGCYTEKAIPWSAGANNSPSVSLATTSGVCTASPSLSAAVLVPAGATSLVAAVTPYTHAAVGLAEYGIRTGSAVTVALTDADSLLSQWVGANIQTTLPAAPARASTLSAATLYGGLLSAVPSWLMNVATTAPAVFGSGSLTTLAFADAMKSDLAQDGVLNGVGRDAGGNAVAVTVGNATMTTTIYRHQLAFYSVIRLRAETEGAPAATTEEQGRIVSFLPSLTAYNDAASSLLDASALVALDEGGPVVTVGYPSPGATIGGNSSMAGFAHDSVGIPALSTVMLIDGVQYTPFTNQYIPNHFINTTVFANGSHILTIRATNNLGHVSSASVTVNFFN